MSREAQRRAQKTDQGSGDAGADPVPVAWDGQHLSVGEVWLGFSGGKGPLCLYSILQYARHSRPGGCCQCAANINSNSSVDSKPPPPPPWNRGEPPSGPVQRQAIPKVGMTSDHLGDVHFWTTLPSPAPSISHNSNGQNQPIPAKRKLKIRRKLRRCK